MPTYEYECTACGQHIEVFQRIDEDPLSTCGVCGGALRKVFHPIGIVFKGSGFYATDNRAKKKDADAPSSAKPSEDGAKTETSKSADTSKTSPAPKDGSGS